MSVTSVNSKVAVQTAIAQASRQTGIDFDYLLGQAQVESGLRSNARAGTSSATGLYQFVDQSWLSVVKQHGAENGLGWAANSIQRNSSGRYVVSDPDTRRAILNLRTDPQTSAIMAAEHAADNKTALESSLDRPATGTDLYMAHFLGLGGARSFLSAMDRNPGRTGASMFPAAARANRSIFYAPNGQPRSLGQIYSRLSSKLDSGATSAGATGLASDTLGSGMQNATDTIDANGNEVILGNGAVDRDRHWVETTLAQLNGNAGSSMLAVNPLRPTPETAKLAYLMLASLGA
jgi:hypothetical protein